MPNNGDERESLRCSDS